MWMVVSWPDEINFILNLSNVSRGCNIFSPLECHFMMTLSSLKLKPKEIKSMNITQTRLQAPLTTPVKVQAAAPQDSTSFFIDIDPFSGIKDAFHSVAETGASFAIGAAPVFGANELAGAAIIGGFGGRSNSESRLAFAGAGMNAVGSIGLLVAGGQYLFGADPTIALGVAAAGLGGAGIASTIYMS